MATAPSSQARLSFQEAFERLRRSVSTDDARDFQSTDLQHVREAARDIERQLAARQCLRNLRRIQPLFDGLERYSKTVEILCNGTPYLPWIWAPVKLMLQLASDYNTAFEKLITAYDQIADVLPRFDRLSAAFQDNHDLQQVLGFVYADILDFHGRAYRFFRRRGWRCFFSSCWARFDLRFKGILESLAKNCELVDREAASISIVEAKAWRTKTMEEAAAREKESSILQFQAVISWLQVADSLQEDELDQLLRRCHLGTCDWITRNPKISGWMKLGIHQKVMWLKGKPGSGKSVLCAKIVRFLQQDKQTVVLYYFYNSYRTSNASNLTMILRSLCGQLLRTNFDLSAYVFDEYIGKGLSPSVQNLKMMLPSLLSGIRSVRIVIDGLDECDEADFKKILNEIIPLATCDGLELTHKLLVSSRDVPRINRILTKTATISLSEEKEAVEAAIRTYVHAGIVELQNRLDSEISFSILEDIENKIVEKSDGMFLWVRLVLTTIEDADNVKELKDAVDTLPKGLKQIYILDTLSGPFISEKQAHHDIAFACAAYLANSFDLVDPRIPKGDLLIRVGEGFYGLHLYANAYWLDHLLAYVEMSTTLGTDVSNPLVMQLLNLCQTHQQLLAIIPRPDTSPLRNWTDVQADKRLNGLSGYAEIYAIAKQVLVSRQSRIDCRQQKGLQDAQTGEDSTLFSQMLQRYNEIVQSLLSARIVPGLCQEALTIFKKRHGPFAYVCRYHGCEYATTGFASQQVLEKHEATHTPKFVCNALTCEYAVIGFRTSRALKQHLETFHASTATPEIPRSLRRTQGKLSARVEKAGLTLPAQNLKMDTAEPAYVATSPFLKGTAQQTEPTLPWDIPEDIRPKINSLPEKQRKYMARLYQLLQPLRGNPNQQLGRSEMPSANLPPNPQLMQDQPMIPNQLMQPQVPGSNPFAGIPQEYLGDTSMSFNPSGTSSRSRLTGFRDMIPADMIGRRPNSAEVEITNNLSPVIAPNNINKEHLDLQMLSRPDQNITDMSNQLGQSQQHLEDRQQQRQQPQLFDPDDAGFLPQQQLPQRQEPFTPQENNVINALAQRLAETTSQADLEKVRAKIRANLSRMPDRQRVRLEQEGVRRFRDWKQQQLLLQPRQQQQQQEGQQALPGSIAGNTSVQVPQQQISSFDLERTPEDKRAKCNSLPEEQGYAMTRSYQEWVEGDWEQQWWQQGQEAQEPLKGTLNQHPRRSETPTEIMPQILPDHLQPGGKAFAGNPQEHLSSAGAPEHVAPGDVLIQFAEEPESQLEQRQSPTSVASILPADIFQSPFKPGTPAYPGSLYKASSPDSISPPDLVATAAGPQPSVVPANVTRISHPTAQDVASVRAKLSEQMRYMSDDQVNSLIVQSRIRQMQNPMPQPQTVSGEQAAQMTPKRYKAYLEQLQQRLNQVSRPSDTVQTRGLPPQADPSRQNQPHLSSTEDLSDSGTRQLLKDGTISDPVAFPTQWPLDPFTF